MRSKPACHTSSRRKSWTSSSPRTSVANGVLHGRGPSIAHRMVAASLEHAHAIGCRPDFAGPLQSQCERSGRTCLAPVRQQGLPRDRVSDAGQGLSSAWGSQAWQDFTTWRANACISIPTFRCFECGARNLDGSVYCWRCAALAEPHSDLSSSLAPDRSRQLATLTGQPSNFVSLQPRGDTNRNRNQQARSGRAEPSGPAVVKGQATKLLRKGTNAGLALEDTLTDNPLLRTITPALGSRLAPWKW